MRKDKEIEALFFRYLKTLGLREKYVKFVNGVYDNTIYRHNYRVSPFYNVLTRFTGNVSYNEIFERTGYINDFHPKFSYRYINEKWYDIAKRFRRLRKQSLNASHKS